MGEHKYYHVKCHWCSKFIPIRGRRGHAKAISELRQHIEWKHKQVYEELLDWSIDQLNDLEDYLAKEEERQVWANT